MAIEKGDIVKIVYTGYAKNSGAVVDTTDEKIAKENGIFDERRRYGPLIVRLGKGQLIEGLEEAITGMNEGEKKEVEIPPEKAYGPRDDNLVKIIPEKEFKKAGLRPIPGHVINVDDRPAMIKAVNSGRVVVDFNHPLAGVPLKYEVEVLKVAKSPEEKVRLLAEKYEIKGDVKREGDKVVVSLEKKDLKEGGREVYALTLMANELKEEGVKDLAFSGEWGL